MKKDIDLLKKKIERAKLKKQELLVELNLLREKILEKRKFDDLKKIEELRKQLLNNA